MSVAHKLGRRRTGRPSAPARSSAGGREVAQAHRDRAAGRYAAPKARRRQMGAVQR